MVGKKRLRGYRPRKRSEAQHIPVEVKLRPLMRSVSQGRPERRVPLAYASGWSWPPTCHILKCVCISIPLQRRCLERSFIPAKDRSPTQIVKQGRNPDCRLAESEGNVTRLDPSFRPSARLSRNPATFLRQRHTYAGPQPYEFLEESKRILRYVRRPARQSRPRLADSFPLITNKLEVLGLVYCGLELFLHLSKNHWRLFEVNELHRP